MGEVHPVAAVGDKCDLIAVFNDYWVSSEPAFDHFRSICGGIFFHSGSIKTAGSPIPLSGDGVVAKMDVQLTRPKAKREWTSFASTGVDFIRGVAYRQGGGEKFASMLANRK